MPRPALLLALALAALPVLAVAAPLELVIKGHAFTPAELRVKAGEPIELRVVNRDATAEEFEFPRSRWRRSWRVTARRWCGSVRSSPASTSSWASITRIPPTA